MCVDRDGRQTFDRRHVAQMFAETRFVDCKIVIEWQQNGPGSRRGEHESRAGAFAALLFRSLLSCALRSIT